MHPRAIVAIFLLVVSSLCPAQCSKPDLKEYLAFGAQLKDQEFRWIFERIELRDWGNDVDSLAANLETIARLTLDATRHGGLPILSSDDFKIETYDDNRMFWLNTAVENLLSFAGRRTDLLKCHNNEVRALVALAEIGFGGLKDLVEVFEQPNDSLLLEYLRKYGLQHVQECLDSTLDSFSQDLQHLKPVIELKLDTLVSLGDKFAPEERTVRLIARAETLDLAKGNFDAKKMLISVRPLMKPKEQRLSTNPGEVLVSFLRNTCVELNSALKRIDMYNLAKFLIPDSAAKVKVPPRFRKLNEYSRICIPFGNYKSGKAAELNVLKNMK